MSKERPRTSAIGPKVLMVAIVMVFLFPVSAMAQSTDAKAMGELKQSLKLPSSVDWSGTNPCNWQGVRCENQRVTRIQLGNQGVSGSLPDSVASLSSLQVFELMGNSISGALPSLSGLSSLQTLNLHDNQFNSVPSNFFDGMSSLQEVYLDNNPFKAWSIPDGLKGASSLKNFSANSANIVGGIPDFFNSNTFPSMVHLHLTRNHLQGGLPSSFSGFGLQTLWLTGQNDSTGARTLGGTIAVLQNMTQLVQVWLNMNGFTGPIPDLSGLTDLVELNLRDCSLTGPVPVSLIKLPSLKLVNLTNNNLQGPTPAFPSSVSADLKPGQNSFCLSDPGMNCDSRVNALISIMEPFGYPLSFADQWLGNDPCNSWFGITCSQGNITLINLQSRNLSGTISPAFAALTSLQTISLAHNNITGTVPDALAKMPNLKTLDISYNQVYGKLPAFTHTNVNTQGNPDFGKDHPSTSPSGSGSSGGSNTKRSKTRRVVVAVVVSSVCAILIVGAVLYFFVFRKKQYGKVQSTKPTLIHPKGSDDAFRVSVAKAGANGNAVSESHSLGSSGPSEVHVIETNNLVISIEVLRNVTNNFSENKVLGKGGFGTVYEGELHDGTKIAVKRMNSGILGDKGLSEFKSEIAVLTKVRHRHLVGLLGYCLDGNEKILVYEYLPQGALSRHLFSWKDEGLKPLEWKQRLTIALDVARGVEYLHSLAHQSFIHRDLKPSNILLGDDMRAKVADFGLVRLAPGGGKFSIETRLAGTFGYLAPEYAVMGRITTKVDVYSFGVILMEIITGRRALDETQPEESMHLVTWFRRMSISKETFHKSIDPSIDLDEETLASVSTVAELAGHCCAREPSQRPEMGHTVNVLSSLTDVWKPTEEDSEDNYGIDLNLTLPQALKKWQAIGDSNVDASSSSFLRSGDNTQTSIPTRPSGFADSFTSADGRGKSTEQNKSEQSSVYTFRKPTKNKNIRKRTVELDEGEDDKTESSLLHNAKKAQKSDNKFFTSGQSKRPASSNVAATEVAKNAFFVYESSKEIQIQNDSKATATLETETDFSRDTRALRERALKQAEESLKGKGKANASSDGKVYRGIHGYTDHKAGFRREQTIASEKAGGAHGPLRASAHIRVSARWDYQPDICKDYKETGYCGYGDSCKFLHDRGDYKSGWQLEKEYEEVEKERKRKLAMGIEDSDEEDEDGDDDSLPFACFICRQPFVNAVMTKCKHYFCESCALKHHRKNKKCFVCNQPTLGIFNTAHEIRKRMVEDKN